MAGDEVQLAAGHVGTTVAQLERRIYARFGERRLTKAVRDLAQLVVLVHSEADLSRPRLRRTTLAARATSIAIIAATLFALVFGLRSAVIDRSLVIPRAATSLGIFHGALLCRFSRSAASVRLLTWAFPICLTPTAPIFVSRGSTFDQSRRLVDHFGVLRPTYPGSDWLEVVYSVTNCLTELQPPFERPSGRSARFGLG